MRVVLKQFYETFPTALKEWAQVAYHMLPAGWRYGKAYRDALSLFCESDWWDEGKLREYQEERLRRLIHHSYEHVPYYREVFRERGLTPGDISGIADLPKLPILTKDVVRLRRQDLLANNIARTSMEAAHTSGSSGTPLDFYMDKRTRPVDRALALRRILWLGYRPGDVIAYFKGLPLVNPSRYIRYFPGAGELRVSFHTVNEGRLNEMVNALIRYRPTFVDAWPSCLSILSRWIERTGRSVPAPKYIVTASENLYPHIKDKIESVFQAPVIDWYGQEESVAVAMQCAYGREYHIQMEMGIVELVCPGQDLTGEIVGTCLHNFAMPLLRYKTGDLAVTGGGEPCPCGRKHPTFARVMGRDSELVIVPEGRPVSPLILHFAFYHLDEIKEAQIIQEDIHTLRVKLVPWKVLSERTRRAVVDELHDRLESPSMSVIVEEEAEIAKTRGGKRPFVITKLNVEDYL
ncbi:MAG: phenylacetate--CoA ligase family protein [Thermodesulfobacteriota bacterium]